MGKVKRALRPAQKEKAMPEIPEAKQATVKGSRQNPAFPRNPERRLEHTYTRRTGICPKPGHKGRTSTSFMGVNEHGWLFHCSYVDDAGHAFVNRPPAAGTAT